MQSLSVPKISGPLQRNFLSSTLLHHPYPIPLKNKKTITFVFLQLPETSVGTETTNCSAEKREGGQKQPETIWGQFPSLHRFLLPSAAWPKACWEICYLDVPLQGPPPYMHLDLAFTDPQLEALEHIEKQDENPKRTRNPRWGDDVGRHLARGASVACLLLVVGRVLWGLSWAWAVTN